VIDLGAGPGDVGKALIDKGCKVTVVDMARFPADTGDIEVHVQNLNDPLTFDVSSKDTILMLDVIEHLADPEDFLDRLRSQFSHEPKTLILSTPNIAFVVQRLALMFGQFNYGRTGILDRTHTRLFTFRTLRHLLRDAGFEIKSMRGVPAPFPLVAGDTVGGWLSAVNEFLIRISKSLFSFQILVVAESTPDVRFLLDDAQRKKRESA
jgi:2-polyprenyl-3-methyl-5-hydroxy-6-metoxy-1,4-benzoquinol methylase